MEFIVFWINVSYRLTWMVLTYAHNGSSSYDSTPLSKQNVPCFEWNNNNNNSCPRVISINEAYDRRRRLPWQSAHSENQKPVLLPNISHCGWTVKHRQWIDQETSGAAPSCAKLWKSTTSTWRGQEQSAKNGQQKPFLFRFFLLKLLQRCAGRPNWNINLYVSCVRLCVNLCLYR